MHERLAERTKYWIEAIGCAVMLIPFSILGAWLTVPYVQRSYAVGEVSRSLNGLSDIWILKSGVIVLFVLMGLAGVSVFIKAVAGLTGHLPQSQRAEVING